MKYGRLVAVIVLSVGGSACAQDHWAFQPIRRPVLPATSAWCRTTIDRFVQAKLREKNFQPSARASRQTLLRRLYFDLLGLPPKWADVQCFVLDDRPGAYERLVDRLLASPRYGERWGRHWLDLARFADSSGYESDRPREIWRYRDWVVWAINRGMPFDQFVQQQLAGDLFPNATNEHRIATGFHCNSMLDPGVRWESIVERVETTGAVLLGLTLGCARCHTHKTDPVSHREFFQFYAFFNETSLVKLPLAMTGKEGKPRTTLVLKQANVPTHLMIQGDPARKGERVSAGVPAFLPKLSLVKGKKPTRLDLARWLFDPNHPLTARVTANRVWQRFFGLGLVASENDFGVQTPPPTHPRLLEYLACELRDGGWDMKRLHRQIVLSAVYQQSSNMSAALRKVDRRNRWLARQTRLRLEAELVRDVPLAIAGMMDHRIGGPSVFPYQPPGILKNRATPAKWIMSKGGDQYRRSMYTWIWRLTPHPMMALFDAPDGVTACTRRHRTNTPVSALTTLNDPVFAAAARNLAYQVVKSSPSQTQPARIQYLFRKCLARNPSTAEMAIVKRLLQRQLVELAGDHRAVRKMLALKKADSVSKAMVETAVWMVVCRIVLNMDEMITRE